MTTGQMSVPAAPERAAPGAPAVIEAVGLTKTLLTFGTASSAQSRGAAFLLLLYGILALSYTMLFSVLIPAPAGAAGTGLGIYALLAVGAAWDPLASFGPPGVPGIAAAIAAGQEHVSPAWPAVSSLAVAAAALGVASLIFNRKEL